MKTSRTRSTWGAYTRATLVVVTLSIATPAMAADPLLMFFLGFLKNVIESNLEAEAGRQAMPAPPIADPPQAQVAFKPPAKLTNDDLRTLVHENFAYLSRAQRDELLEGLDKTLADPALAAHRDAVLSEFVAVARQVGFTHRQLDRLSESQKQALADQFVANYRRLPEEHQQQLFARLRQRTLPLPSDLHDMMMTALTASP